MSPLSRLILCRLILYLLCIEQAMLRRSVKADGYLEIDRNGARLDLQLFIKELMWPIQLSQICGVSCQAKD